MPQIQQNKQKAPPSMSLFQPFTALRSPARCFRLLLLLPVLSALVVIWTGRWAPAMTNRLPLLTRPDVQSHAERVMPSEQDRQTPQTGSSPSMLLPADSRLSRQLEAGKPPPQTGYVPSANQPPPPTAPGPSRQLPVNKSMPKTPTDPTTQVPANQPLAAKTGSATSPQPVASHQTIVTTQATAANWSSQVIQLPPGPDSTRPTSYNNTRIILFWNKFYSNADFYVGYGQTPFIGCPQDDCVTTSNRSLLHQADAVLFHMLNQVLPVPERLPHQRFVFFLKEPPTLAAIRDRDRRLRGVFNLTMTYRLDSDVVNDYFSVSPGAELTPVPDITRRSRAVAWIVSHCETASGRELYADELERFIDVDVYGKCGGHQCPTKAHGGSRHECHRMVAEKYHFYLSFENSQCRHYVTEKLSLALQYGMVPVVLGDDRKLYERIAPANSFIHIADFAGPEQLAEYLRYLMANRTAYLQYFKWRRHQRIDNARGWCNLCRYLHEDHPPQYYDDVGSWWVDGGACHLDTVIPEPETGEEDMQPGSEQTSTSAGRQEKHPGKDKQQSGKNKTKPARKRRSRREKTRRGKEEKKM